MGAAVSITRLDLTAFELRKAASGENDQLVGTPSYWAIGPLHSVEAKAAIKTAPTVVTGGLPTLRMK